jgi:hypothetical protein
MGLVLSVSRVTPCRFEVFRLHEQDRVIWRQKRTDEGRHGDGVVWDTQRALGNDAGHADLPGRFFQHFFLLISSSSNIFSFSLFLHVYEKYGTMFLVNVQKKTKKYKYFLRNLFSFFSVLFCFCDTR